LSYRQKGSPYYWVTLTLPTGQRVRRSTETTSKREADAIEAKWRAELHQQRYWDAPKPLLLSACLKTYLDATQVKRSHREDRIRAVTLLERLGDVSVYEIDSALLQRYVQERLATVKPATINRELALLSVALNHARKIGFDRVPNPTRGLKMREAEIRLRWLTEGEAAALIEAAKTSKAEFLADWIRVALDTGLRAGELCRLRWGDVMADRLTVQASNAKSGRSRTIPLTPAAQAAIKRQPKRSVWVFSQPDGLRVLDVRTAMRNACARAGIEPITPHVLRHTCASWLVQRGVPIYLVRAMLGHSTIAVTERYAHLAPDHLQECVAALSNPSSLNMA
jgi:integrase